MEKKDILREISRTAAENDGMPLGVQRFETETGVKQHQWRGRFWARWSDALREAGFEPNKKTLAYDRDVLMAAVASLARRYGRFPTWMEIRMERTADPTFPSATAFHRTRELGTQAGLAAALLDYCYEHPEFNDVRSTAEAVKQRPNSRETTVDAPAR